MKRLLPVLFVLLALAASAGAVEPEEKGASAPQVTDKLTVQRLLDELNTKKATVALQVSSTVMRGEISGINGELVALDTHPDRFTTERVYIPLSRIEAVFVSGK